MRLDSKCLTAAPQRSRVRPEPTTQTTFFGRGSQAGNLTATPPQQQPSQSGSLHDGRPHVSPGRLMPADTVQLSGHD